MWDLEAVMKLQCVEVQLAITSKRAAVSKPVGLEQLELIAWHA